MLPEAIIKHQIPGRTRLKISEKRGDQEYFSWLQQRLAECSQINQFSANPLTGSLLIIHEGGIGDIEELARKHGWFSVANGAILPVSVQDKVLEQLNFADAALFTTTKGKYDLRGSIFIVLMLLTIYQALQGKILAPASTLFWHALSTLQAFDANTGN